VARTRAPKTESIASQVATRNRETKIEEPGSLIPTPSTLLNCACSDSPYRAFSKGRLINLIGDSHSGKTLLALTTFGEMNLDSEFDNYRFIYDDVENANEFDMQELIGKEAADRVEAPHYDEDDYPEPSNYIEDFHCNLWDALDEEEPFIYKKK